MPVKVCPVNRYTTGDSDPGAGSGVMRMRWAKLLAECMSELSLVCKAIPRCESWAKPKPKVVESTEMLPKCNRQRTVCRRITSEWLPFLVDVWLPGPYVRIGPTLEIGDVGNDAVATHMSIMFGKEYVA